MTNGTEGAVAAPRLTIRSKREGLVVYEIDATARTVRFHETVQPFAVAERMTTALRADLEKLDPKPPAPSPEPVSDFLGQNINALLEIPAGYVVRRGPRFLRWLWPYVIAKE